MENEVKVQEQDVRLLCHISVNVCLKWVSGMPMLSMVPINKYKVTEKIPFTIKFKLFAMVYYLISNCLFDVILNSQLHFLDKIETT